MNARTKKLRRKRSLTKCLEVEQSKGHEGERRSVGLFSLIFLVSYFQE